MKSVMISAPQPEAVEVGLGVFEAGGNVMDAAIAAAMVQTVVDPQMCGIAGFGSMQTYFPKRGGHQFIDFHGRAPLATKPDMWAEIIEHECDDGFGFVLKDRVNEFGYQSMTSPMTLGAFDHALRLHGTKSFSELIQPAIDFAENGFLVRPGVYAFWMRPPESGRIARAAVVNKLEAARKIYLDEYGDLLKVGSVLKNPDMASTLRRVAKEGVEVFYKGEIADQIESDMIKNGGLISKKDLSLCKPKETAPLIGSYRGLDVATNQLPGGGALIIQMLNILENFDLRALGHNSMHYISIVAETMKYATIDKDRYMGDPSFVDVPLELLLDKKYALEISRKISSGKKADVVRFRGSAPESKDTTHLVVADNEGNVVNLTHSLGSSSGVITDGLGFMYNNCMMVFDPRPGKPGSLAPGKARFTAMCPTILLKNDKPFLALGAPGGTTITMGILQTILNVVDFNMSAGEAVSAPRFCATSNTIELTNRIFRGVENKLNLAGYPTFRNAASYVTPRVHAIRMIDDKLDGGADPAGDGMVALVTQK